MKQYRIDYYNKKEWVSTEWIPFRSRRQAETYAYNNIAKVAYKHQADMNDIMYEVR